MAQQFPNACGPERVRGRPRPPALTLAPAGPQKLQLVLEPLHSLASRALDHGLRDPGRFLAHSFQQLDRIDSLSEQVSFLEEQLGSCECLSPPLRPPASSPPTAPGSLSCPQRGQSVPTSQGRGHIGLAWQVVGAVTSDLSPHPSPTGSCKKEL